MSRVKITLLARKSLPLSWSARGNWRTMALAFQVSWCTMRVVKMLDWGLGCLLLERLSADYGEKSRLRLTVWVTEEQEESW